MKLLKIQLTVIFFFVILLLFPLLHSGIYISHDGEAHVARFASYYQAFHDGQFPPRWAGNLNYGYGSPLFIFYYPLPGYIGSLFHMLGLSFEHSYLLIMSLCALLAPITFYLWVKTFLKKEQAIFAALLYGFAPYHFLDLFVRGDIAEMLAFVFVPLVFLFIDKILSEEISDAYQTKTLIKDVLGGSIFLGLLILSHNGISLMFAPVFIFYTGFKLMQTKQWIKILPLFFMFLIGFGLSAFFWLPVLAEKKYVQAALFIGNMYKEHFLSLRQLIYSPWNFGPDVNKPNGLSPQIGVVNMLFSIVAVVFWIKAKRKDITFLFWFVTGISGIFISTSSSAFLWQHISLLRLFEFPWRFSALSSFASVMLVTFFLANTKSKNILLILSAIFLFSCLPFIKVIGYKDHSDSYYLSFPGTTYYHGEASSIWTAGDPSSFAKNPVEIFEGQGTINQLIKKSQFHTYTVSMRTNGKIIDNTIYFPGWRTYVDGKLTTIEFQDIQHRGFITFPVSQGRHTITVIFKETYIRLLADAFSLLSLMMLLFGIIIVGRIKSS